MQMDFLPEAAFMIGAASRQPRKEIARIAGMRSVHDAFGWFSAHERDLAEQQLEVTSIPAPPFQERRRAEWMLGKFAECGLQRLQIDEIDNVIGLIPGTEQGPLVVLGAHLDTVFTETRLDVHREGNLLCGPGIADNGAGLVGLLGIAGALHAYGIRTRLPLLFLANVGEEGEGDLRGMRHFFSTSPWQGNVGYMLALDGAGTDTIVAKALGSRRFEITITGPGGHSWSDFGTPNPIVLLAQVIERLSRILLPQEPRTTLNVGVIEGGTSVNAIPQSAVARVDLRSADPEKIANVESQVYKAIDEVMHAVEALSGVDAHVRIIGDRPAAELPDGAHILDVLRAVDAQLSIPSQLHCASTDANIPLSLGVQALAIGAGGNGARAHTLQEWFDPRGRELALKRVLLTLLALAEVVE